MLRFIFCNAECRYAESPCAECRHAECRYFECPYSECRGTIIWPVQRILLQL